jgi:hypothetical protein
MNGKIVVKRVGGQPQDEREHFIKCAACGRWIETRFLDDILEHERACGGAPPGAIASPNVKVKNPLDSGSHVVSEESRSPGC